MDRLHKIEFLEKVKHMESIGELASGVSYLRSLVKAYPDDGDVHEWLARCYGSRREHAAAERQYKQTVEISPDKFSPNYNLGFVYFKLRRYRKSIERHRYATILKPNDIKP